MGEHPRASYLVGADGGRSTIRKAAGIDFPGWEATRSNLIAEVEVSRGAAAGHAAGRGRRPRAPALGGRPHVPGRHDGAAARSAPPSRPWPTSPTPSRGLRNRLRSAQPDLDLAVHRRDPAGGAVPQRAGAARRGCRAHPLPGGRAGHRARHPGRRQPGLEARTGGQGHLARVACSTPTRPNGIPPRRARCEHSMAQTVLQRADPRTAALTRTIDGSDVDGRAPDAGSPRSSTVSTSRTTSATGTRFSAAAMPDLDLETASGRTTDLRAAARGAAAAGELRRADVDRHRAVGRPSALVDAPL